MFSKLIGFGNSHDNLFIKKVERDGALRNEIFLLYLGKYLFHHISEPVGWFVGAVVSVAYVLIEFYHDGEPWNKLALCAMCVSVYAMCQSKRVDKTRKSLKRQL